MKESVKAKKNLWAKARTKESAYAVITVPDTGWTYYILKAYQRRALEKKNRWARMFCLVVTPFTGEIGDMGDTYISEIPMTAEFRMLLDAREKAEEEAA